MNSGQTIFRQLLQFLPRHDFDLCVRRYRGDYRAISFSAFDQFLCLAYAQMAGRESLRDIETCLNSHREKLYHVGFRGYVSHAPHRRMQISAEIGAFFRISAKS